MATTDRITPHVNLSPPLTASGAGVVTCGGDVGIVRVVGGVAAPSAYSNDAR
ncbi:MAG: hypothetical protein ACO2O2_05350 [Acidilobaceae archaeon]